MYLKKINEIINIRIISLLMSLVIFPQTSQAEQLLSIRVQAGYGVSNSANTLFRGNIRHLGLRGLVHADGTRKFGLEINHFQFSEKNKASDFYSFGIVLEQTLANWFKVSVGTVGYIRYGLNSDNPVGIVTNLGWVPSKYESFKPFVVIRNDFIFYHNTSIMNSISLGLIWIF